MMIDEDIRDDYNDNDDDDNDDYENHIYSFFYTQDQNLNLHKIQDHRKWLHWIVCCVPEGPKWSQHRYETTLLKHTYKYPPGLVQGINPPNNSPS